MRRLHVLSLLGLLIACAAEDVFGPPPDIAPHFTADVEGRPFVGLVGTGGCIGLQIPPAVVLFEAHTAGIGPAPEISINLGDIHGPGIYMLRPAQVPDLQRAALYIGGDAAVSQYSAPAGAGEVDVSEYDPITRRIAGRFYFTALRTVGDTGRADVRVRRGSFRGVLQAWGSHTCD